MIEQLRVEVITLKVKFDKSTDATEKMQLKREYLNKELLILDTVENGTTKKSMFNPQPLNAIKGLQLEPVGLNYIPFIKGAYNILTGRGGSGKSAVALKSMIEYLKLNPKKKGLSFFTEDAKEDIKIRIKIICNNSDCNYDEIVSRVHFITVENDDRIKWAKTSRDGYNIENNYINEVIRFCKSENVGFIIIDPLKRFHSLSENSNDDMDVLVRDIFTMMAVKTDAVLLVLHHSAKGGENGASRGAGTITDSARLGWHIGRYYVKNNESGDVVIDESKKNKIKLTIIKDNNGLEKKCSIRDDLDGSIMNPLSGYFVRESKAPEVTNYQSDNNVGINVDIPDIF